MPEKPEVQAKREVTFKVIVNQPEEPALTAALPQFAKAFSLPEDAAAQILSAAPIVLMTGLTKNEAKLLKPVLIKLSSAGMEFKITVIPDKGIPYVIWPFKPHITLKGIEENIPGIAFEWRNTAVVCPSCGETFAIKPIGKTQQAKPISIHAAIAQTETPARQDETVQAPALKPKPAGVKPQAQKPAPPQELEPEPEEAEIAEAEAEEEAVEATADEPLEVAELTDEQQAEEASAEDEAVEAEPAEEAEAVEEAPAVPVEVASDDTAYEEQPPQQFSGEDLIVMDDAPVIIDVPEEKVPQASPYYIKQEEPEPADATPVEPQAPVVEESAMEAEQLEVVEEEPQAAVKPTVRQKTAIPLKKGQAIKPPAGRPQQASAVSYSVFLDKIVNPSKRTQSAELLSEITGISVEEANGIVNRSVVPVLKNVPQAEAQECLNKFNAIGVKGRITSNAKK
ncbi:MAG: hypothetical protein HZA48_05485 [Planctomycetes bacterium]|nr:hypothetical protein [Planctomycetota bacterium]